MPFRAFILRSINVIFPLDIGGGARYSPPQVFGTHRRDDGNRTSSRGRRQRRGAQAGSSLRRRRGATAPERAPESWSVGVIAKAPGGGCDPLRGIEGRREPEMKWNRGSSSRLHGEDGRNFFFL